MTFSITVLAMEGTGALQLIIPLMLAVFISKIVGDALTPSIYDVQIKLRGAPVLVNPRPASTLGSFEASHAACPEMRGRVHTMDWGQNKSLYAGQHKQCESW